MRRLIAGARRTRREAHARRAGPAPGACRRCGSAACVERRAAHAERRPGAGAHRRRGGGDD
ncbi:MAG: hypothetical protein MZW92_66060 [Comamonadaceae bacterium]|nr:hypothetical protein [Comamonadaceae bacterium]